MPRVRDGKLEYATQRLKLEPNRVPYPGPNLAKGIKLLYRRNHGGAGTWVVRVANNLAPSPGEKPATPYWTKAIGFADDYDPADGVDVLTYHQAQDKAKAIARGGDDGGGGGGKPITVGEALAAYEEDLRGRGAQAVHNVRQVRCHMTPELSGKSVALLTVNDLRKWRDGLAAKPKADGTARAKSSVNRTRVGLRAALEFAAKCDPRIKNRDVFKVGLQGLDDATKAREFVLLPDQDVLRIAVEASAVSEPFGLLVRAMAETGARMSQIVRLNCGDLLPGDRLLVSPSYKGGVAKKKSREPVSVPITAGLAVKLAIARGKRRGDEPLLLNNDGERWDVNDKHRTAAAFRIAVTAAGHDPEVITPYALRHSSICRSIMCGVPVQMVAQLHDTSVKEIEFTYAKYINRVSDDIARRGLLADDNVVSLPRAA